MGVEQNKAVIQRTMEEIWNKGNLSIIPEQISPNYVSHNAGGAEYKGYDGLRQMVTSMRDSFPDLHYTIDEMVAEGDKVLCRYTFSGTHTGSAMGIPPTGKEISARAMIVSTVKNGKTEEVWSIADAITLYQQLGIVPPPLHKVQDMNKEAIRRTLDEIWNKGNLSLIPELFTADYTSYNSSGKNVLGHEGFSKMVETARTAYPDLFCTINQLVAEGETVVCRYTLTGTHKGEYQGIAPTGKKVSVLCLFLTVMRDGKSAETWALSETLASYRQLGIAPPGYELAKEKQPV